MASKGSSDKTEKPTGRRKKDARKKGQVARSTELPQAVSLVVGGLLLPFVVPTFLDRMAESWTSAISADTIAEPGVGLGLMGSMVVDALVLFVPMIAAIAASSVISQFVLAGKPNRHNLKPQWSKISPKNGFGRIFNGRQLWELGRSLAKLSVLVLVTYGIWQTGVDEMMSGPAPVGANLERVGNAVRELFIRVAALGVIIGVADAVYSKRKFIKDLKMTKQEVKEEAKQQEGSPVVKREVRKRQVLMSRNRMIAEVSGAEVVITNPTHIAVALSYSSTDPAPRVVAKGAGRVAERIRAEAREHGVPIREDKPLARTMFRKVKLGDTIPVELYGAVAAILAAVYKARQRRLRRAS
ncbi:MAG: EscU/YscU/HrcU family type III secretion system export apparatus switch protein [Acidimicrobiales bacterium]|nr:EscU/YscU/HrcU family type III secretion system export apparatus switch protein [Acidimicrobiales bacterium]